MEKFQIHARLLSSPFVIENISNFPWNFITVKIFYIETEMSPKHDM